MRRPPTSECNYARSTARTASRLGLQRAARDCCFCGYRPAISPTLAQANKSTPAPAPIKLLKVEPVKGYVGDSFTVTGDGFTPGKKVDFFWSTVDGTYATKVMPDNVEYHERKYEEKRVRLGGNSVDAQGRVNTALYRAGGFRRSARDLCCGGWTGRGPRRLPHLAQRYHHSHRRPRRNADHHHGKGLSWRGFEHFMALRYDNKYTG